MLLLHGGTSAGEVLSINPVHTWSPDHVFYYARPGVSPRATSAGQKRTASEKPFAEAEVQALCLLPAEAK